MITLLQCSARQRTPRAGKVRQNGRYISAKAAELQAKLSLKFRHTHDSIASAFGRLAKFLAPVIALAALFCVGADALIAGAAPSRLPALQHIMARWSGVEIRDADQCFLGVIPGSREGISDFRDGQAGEPADEKAIPVTNVPDGFWDVAVALEHRTIGTWRTLPDIGVDYVALGHALYDTAAGNPRGASTLPQLVAGALLKTDHGSRRGWVVRKAREVTNGAALYGAYSLSPDELQNFRQLVATYLPLARSASSGHAGSLYGIAVTSLILFGKEPSRLTLAEQAVLAAAIKTPIVLAPKNDADGQKLAQVIFDRVKSRARYGLVQSYGEDNPNVHAALAHIDAMPLPQPHLCASLRPYLPSDPSDAFRISFSPVWRAQYFAGEELSQIVSELKSTAGPDFREAVQSVTLTLRMADNLPFKRAVHAELDSVEKFLSPRLSIGLVPGSAQAIGDVLFAASDPRGRIRLYYQSPERPLLDVPRATGSVSKTIAAVSLAQAGSPDDYYCNLRIDGVLRNANGDTGQSRCSMPGGLVSARDSFRKSMNLPIFYALGSDSPDRLRSLMDEAGFAPFHDTALRTALAFGMVSATPADMVRMMTAITNAARGRAASARTPRMIATIVWRSPHQSKNARDEKLDLSPYLTGDTAKRFAASVLSAPLEQGGTAAALENCKDHVSWQLAKTGTNAKTGRIGSKLLVASGEKDGETLTVIGLVGSEADGGDISPITTPAIAQAICHGLEARPQ